MRIVIHEQSLIYKYGDIKTLIGIFMVDSTPWARTHDTLSGRRSVRAKSSMLAKAAYIPP
jgi:hypothetical protein